MFCSKCGCKMPDTANFCPKCGQPVSEFIKNKIIENKSDGAKTKEAPSSSDQTRARQVVILSDMPKSLSFTADEKDIASSDFRALSILLDIITYEGEFFKAKDIIFDVNNGEFSKDFVNKYKYVESEIKHTSQRELECLKLANSINLIKNAADYIERKFKSEDRVAYYDENKVGFKVSLGINEISFLSCHAVDASHIQDDYVYVLRKACKAYRDILEKISNSIGLSIKSLDENPNNNGYIFMSKFIKDNIDAFEKYETSLNTEKEDE